MLIYLNGIPLHHNPDLNRMQVAIPLSNIHQVTQVELSEKFAGRWVFTIELVGANTMVSEPYQTKQEAEMHQFSTVSLINALEVVENLRKNGNFNTYEVAFDWVDVGNRELKRSLIDPNIPIFTIKI